MSGEHPAISLAKSERQAVEKLIGAVPDVTVGANVERRLKTIGKNLTHGTVYSVGCNEQVAVGSQSLDVVDLSTIVDRDSQLLGASLQDLQQMQTCHSRKAVSMDGDFAIPIDHIDVVPGLKFFGDLGV